MQIEKKVHEHAGDAETAWTDVGNAPGVRVWRIEAFRVVPWPAERLGTFYDGDSYIVLHVRSCYQLFVCLCVLNPRPADVQEEPRRGGPCT
jgi:hypothetical protein